MQAKPAFHSSPNGRHDKIFGHLLEPGDVIEHDDLYDSTTGHWWRSTVAGCTLGAGSAATWVRPAPTITVTVTGAAGVGKSTIARAMAAALAAEGVATNLAEIETSPHTLATMIKAVQGVGVTFVERCPRR